jgi:hypothetical protein
MSLEVTNPENYGAVTGAHGMGMYERPGMLRIIAKT